MMNLDFIENGIEVIPNFLTQSEVENLRAELKELFSKSALYGPGYSIYLSKTVQSIPFPTVSIERVNLLEKAIDIFAHLSKISGLKEADFKLANIGVYRERGNKKELEWHSDMRNGGLIRAQICLTGGQANSGAFRYIVDSHKLQDISYNPPRDFLTTQRDKIFVCNKPNGHLFLFNTLGYHSKDRCNEERISIMFDFLPKSFIESNPGDVAANVVLSSHSLTPKVRAHIDLFANGVTPDSRARNTSDGVKFSLAVAGLTSFGFVRELVRMILGKFRRKTSSVLRLVKQNR